MLSRYTQIMFDYQALSSYWLGCRAEHQGLLGFNSVGETLLTVPKRFDKNYYYSRSTGM